MFKSGINIYRKKGFRSLFSSSIQFVYNNFVRPQLPKTGDFARLNGVPVEEQRLFDNTVPWWTPPGGNIVKYETELVRSIRTNITSGSTVLIVGGGWGVSTVAAANAAGPHGSVITYEGSQIDVKRVEKSIRLNNVFNIVDVHHAVVGPAISLRGSQKGADTVKPDSLPSCDVLVLDCEGAELDILQNMTARPDMIIVESHGIYDAPSEIISEVLTDLGYHLKSKDVAESRHKNACIKNDIFVLTAVRERSL